MRADLMTWMQRLVVLVLLAGLAGLGVASGLLIRSAQALPVLGLSALIAGGAVMALLAAATLALMAIAREMRRVAWAQRAGGVAPLVATQHVPARVTQPAPAWCAHQTPPPPTAHPAPQSAARTAPVQPVAAAAERQPPADAEREGSASPIFAQAPFAGAAHPEAAPASGPAVPAGPRRLVARR